ncbi:MAG: hypothetical protein EBU46_20065 [Nitrosomonadaceae bacterium]|nr:hypothetical protein [Nitrosomonadaceae bacterium]
MNGYEDISFDQNVADEIAACYQQIVTGYRPTSPRQVPPNVKTAAIKAAAICEQSHTDPRVYVQAQRRYASQDGEFYPNQLHTSNALENVAKYKTFVLIPLDPEKLYATQLLYLTSALRNTKRSVESILMDKTIQFYPWFRILITRKPNESIIKEYGETARQQMVPFLEDFLKKKTYEDGTPFDLTRIPKKK